MVGTSVRCRYVVGTLQVRGTWYVTSSFVQSPPSPPTPSTFRHSVQEETRHGKRVGGRRRMGARGSALLVFPSPGRLADVVSIRTRGCCATPTHCATLPALVRVPPNPPPLVYWALALGWREQSISGGCCVGQFFDQTKNGMHHSSKELSRIKLSFFQYSLINS